ncbi:MAG: addiction module protein [Candidatus Aminicenantes bacterium]|nr:addiction module protein [Candidatus Aminicenantes bacterium]
MKSPFQFGRVVVVGDTFTDRSSEIKGGKKDQSGKNYIEEEWLALAEKRWIEIEEGKVQCIPAEEAMMKARTYSRYS